MLTPLHPAFIKVLARIKNNFFSTEVCHFKSCKNRRILHRRVFVMPASHAYSNKCLKSPYGYVMRMIARLRYIPQFDLHYIDAGKRHASHCNRPICEHDV